MGNCGNCLEDALTMPSRGNVAPPAGTQTGTFSLPTAVANYRWALMETHCLAASTPKLPSTTDIGHNA